MAFLHSAPRFFAVLLIAFLSSTTALARAADPPPMTGDTVVLDTIEVGPTYEIANLSDLVKAQAKYDALPQSVRDAIGLRFYLVERRSRKILAGPALEKVHLQLATSDSQNQPLPLARDGQVDIPLGGKRLRGRIVANVSKDRADVGFRLFIKLPLNKPLTLGFMRSAVDTFLEAYKPYAGIVFRTFIGNHKPNCFGMNFFEPQSIQVTLPNTTTPVWSSQPGTRVVAFFSDIPTNDPNAVISWTDDEAPYLSGACLMNRDLPR
jgi:hypothetical protein